MSVFTSGSLPLIPHHKFTKLNLAEFSYAELDSLGAVCAFTGFDPRRVTRDFAGVLLALAYNLPHQFRQSHGHLDALLRLAHQALTMLWRAEIEYLVAANPHAAAELLERCEALLVEVERVRSMLQRGAK